MIFDAHVHIADRTDLGGFRTPPLTGEHLVKLMDGPFHVDGRQRRIDRALLQPLISVPEASDPLAHHRYVAEQVAAHADRFIGCFVANPLLDTELTISCLRQLVTNSGFRAVKFHPSNLKPWFIFVDQVLKNGIWGSTQGATGVTLTPNSTLGARLLAITTSFFAISTSVSLSRTSTSPFP